eukprot:COSAG05_NODE_572_length_8615_cov_58.796031_4_plen_80_part_00
MLTIAATSMGRFPTIGCTRSRPLRGHEAIFRCTVNSVSKFFLNSVVLDYLVLAAGRTSMVYLRIIGRMLIPVYTELLVL